MSCHYHTSPWNCIDYTGCDLTQFRYHVKVFPKSGLTVDSNRVNKNIANAWRRLKRISESRFLKLIYCYAIYSFPEMPEFLFISRFILKPIFPSTEHNPNHWLFFSFILVHRLLIYFVPTLILRTMLPLPISLCVFCTRALQ